MQIFCLIRNGMEPLLFQDQAKAMLTFKEINSDENPIQFYAVETEIVL